MKAIENIYDEMCSYEELYNAYLSARRQKRYRGEVMRFADNLEENLWEIHRELMAQTYEVGRYRKFYVHEPKIRLVMALKFKDRVVQWAIYQKLMPFYDRLFIEDSYACRKGKGVHKARDKFQYWMRQVNRKPGKWYYLKLDISKYFYRIDHQILIEILSRRIKDERLMRLLSEIINSRNERFGLPEGLSPDDCTPDMWRGDVGMPIGNLTSQMFANVYLNELDQYCKHQLKIHYYIRYMDDIVILSDSKDYLKTAKETLRAFLRDKLRLSLNGKTAIRPCGLGIEFCGYYMHPTHRKLKRQTARRIKRSMKHMCEGLAAGTFPESKFVRAIASYSGVLMFCDSHGLKEKLNGIYIEAMQKKETKQEGKNTDARLHCKDPDRTGRTDKNAGPDHKGTCDMRPPAGRGR